MSLVVASALAVLGGTAFAGELHSQGPLAITAPDHLVLGKNATAIVHFRPEPGAHLETNVGSLSDPVSDGDQLRVTLTLPNQRSPKLAIITAVAADGGVADWLAIPLAGQARVKVDTEPLASVVVRVGTTEFGPVRADRAGVAQIDIDVPPGIPQATTIATGSHGAVREKPMPLGVPAFNHVVAICAGVGDRVSIIAALPNGAPSPTAPRLTASSGTLGAATPTSNGVFVASHDGEVAGDTADISASFAGEEATAGTCQLRIPPEAPYAIRIAADRGPFVAGTGAVTLSVALDYHGTRRPLEISTITLDSDFGKIAIPIRGQTGWTATWTIPDALQGRRTTHASVRATVPHGELKGELDLPVSPASPVRIELAGSQKLRGNGTASGTLVARVLDRFDNVVPTNSLVAHARGHVGSFAVQADGSAVASYTSAHVRDSDDDVVEVSDRASGVKGQTRIHLDGVGRLLALSARFGYLSNLGRVSTPVGAVSADVRVPLLDERLVAGVQIFGYTQSLDVAAMDESVTGRLSVLPALGRLAYRRSLGPVDAWIGGGAGAAFASSHLASASTGTHADSSTRFAATGFVGGAVRTGPGWIVVEGAYLHSTLSSTTISGRIGGVIATGGFVLEL